MISEPDCNTILPHQVIKQEQYCETCDVFSYGTVVWELVTYEVPFEGLNAEFSIMTAITTGKVYRSSL